MRKSFLKVLSAMVLSSAALFVFAQPQLTVNQGYPGDTTVSGTASSGQLPLTIYDTSQNPRKSLGTSQSIDSSGNFAVVLTNPLILGHSIVVVDGVGNTSPEMVVIVRPKSPSHQ
jgi:hypothetical protein